MVLLSEPRSGFARVPYSQRCKVTQRSGAAEVGVLCNISVLGVYVTLNESPEVGETIELEFPLPGLDHPVRTTGTVTWQNSDEPQHVDDLPRGCGVRFDNLPEAEGLQIAALVKEYLSRRPTERGVAVRVPYVQRCQLTIAGAECSGALCNLSVLGVYVTLEPIPETGEPVTVSFLLPGDARPFQAGATVTWQNLDAPESLDGMPPGCGLRFENVPPVDLARIERAIRDYDTRAAS